jgi:hypothetical protein
MKKDISKSSFLLLIQWNTKIQVRGCEKIVLDGLETRNLSQLGCVFPFLGLLLRRYSYFHDGIDMAMLFFLPLIRQSTQ